MAGGGGDYAGYTIPSKLATNDNAAYGAVVTAGAAGNVTITGTSNSTPNASTVTGTVDATGKMTFTSSSFTGDFI
jgi:hypothetical protein